MKWIAMVSPANAEHPKIREEPEGEKTPRRFVVYNREIARGDVSRTRYRPSRARTRGEQCAICKRAKRQYAHGPVGRFRKECHKENAE